MAAEASYGSLPFAEQIAFFRGKVDLPTKAWTDLWEGMHARAFVVAGAQRDELVADLRAAVDKAIAEGTTLAEFRRDFDQVVARQGWSYNGKRGWRSRVIYDTNLRTSYQAGRYKQMKEVVDRRPYWRYRHNDAVTHPRPQHVAWDGVVLRSDDPWWSTHFPPNGWGCQCYLETLAERDLPGLGKSGPDEAPPLREREVTVGKRGPSPRTVRVPRGIDPGWAYNVGEAAWGRAGSERLVAEAGGGWERLTQGDWRSHGRPREVPLVPPVAQPGPVATSTGDMVAAIERAIGGAERVFRLDTGGFSYPIYVNAELLGRHLALERAPFVPLLPEVLQDPYEVWATFQRSTRTGQVALRLRFIRAVELQKARSLVFVADVRAGRLMSWTLVAGRRRAINSRRVGKLLTARD